MNIPKLTTTLALVLISTLIITPASAGKWHHNKSYGHKNHSHKHHHSSHRAGAFIGGAILGAMVFSVIEHNKHQQHKPYQGAVVYRQLADGSCYLVRHDSDGNELLQKVSRNHCQ